MKNLLLIVAITVAACPSLAGQTAPCRVGTNAPPVGFWTWEPDSTIEVYAVETHFTESELAYLQKPLRNWNAVAGLTGSRVRFEYRGTTVSPRYCQNCVTIVRGSVFDKSKRHLTELRAYSAASDRRMTWATIVVDPRLTNTDALTNALAHELGHSFGLLDCYSCKQNSSVMIQFKSVNVSNNMAGPSACDVVQVKSAYQTLSKQAKRAVPVKPAVSDEGEEPVDDDTPIVVPKP